VPDQPVRLKGWRHLPAERQLEVHRYNLAALMLRDPALIDGLALQVHTANVVRDRMPRRRLATTDILARSLAQVRCPVHAIYGRDDALYPGLIGTLEGAYAAAAPHFRGMALVEGAGHWVQFEKPAAFERALWAALDNGAVESRGTLQAP
jgi:2-hydroxy-6-oxonona-2,4-dienedioate hydrolase